MYETFEGGPGYWIGQLPTKTPKWRVNSAVGCYKDQTATPLFNFGEAGAPHPCESMGIAQLSNTLLMAPDVRDLRHFLDLLDRACHLARS